MRTVAVCASKKYAKQVAGFCDQLEKLGVTVFRPNFKEPIAESIDFGSVHLKDIMFKGLTLEHFDWIRKADTVFVYNKDDYVGASVTLEIGFSNALGKPTYALSYKTGDPARDILIDKIAKTPRALVKLLK